MQHLELCSVTHVPWDQPAQPRPAQYWAHSELGAQTGTEELGSKSSESGLDVGVPLFWARICCNMLLEVTVSSLGLFPDLQKFDLELPIEVSM